MTPELAAFRAVDFDWVRHLQSVWHDTPYNVEDLHKPVADRILDDFARLSRPGASSLTGHVVVGQAGSGKTHLIGTLRRRVWEADGWFVLLDIVGITDFWQTAALGFINSLLQPMPDGRPQYEAIMMRVLKSVPQHVLKAVAQEEGGIRKGNIVETAKRYVAILQRAHPPHAMQHRDVVRAFLLLRDENTQNAAYSWLQGLDIEPEERKAIGFFGPPPKPTELVRGMSWLMSLAGPTMIAVDQIDPIVTAANLSAGLASDTDDDVERKARSIIETLAGGLMDIRDVTSRSVTVVTCLAPTWNVLKSRALKPALQRFNEPVPLEPPRGSEPLEQILIQRLSPAYGERGFAAPYSTWPFTRNAVHSARGLLPRVVLMRCEDHRRRCLAAGQVFECESLAEPHPGPNGPAPTGLDAVFGEHLSRADIEGLLDPADESKALRDLIAATLALYVRQTDTPEHTDVELRDDPNAKNPTLHGRVVFTFHAENDREQHFCFRVINQANAIAFQARLRAALTASGVDRTLPFRHLVILRRGEVPGGPKTKELTTKLREAGGKLVDPSPEDLRAFVALRDMARASPDGFEAWLRTRKPLSDTALFKAAGLSPPPLGAGGPAAGSGREREPVAPANTGGAGGDVAEAKDAELTPPAPDSTGGLSAGPPTSDGSGGPYPHPKVTPRPQPPAVVSRASPAAIPVGRRIEGGREGRAEVLAADLLPRHTAILAGSGSGKTVLLRRIVEEAAILGTPAIVLDTNNDLARLGEPWPERPQDFSDEDTARAAHYQARADVVVWTPGISAGNPLFLSVLPNFAALGPDPDELEQAIQMARTTLAPLAGVSGTSGKLKSGVLAEALRGFARDGGNRLDHLIDYLADLPDGVSGISSATKLAAGMADQLRAAISTDPLLKARGQPLDPALLFAGPNGRTRVSVVNLAGLPDDEQRQGFVNQLQMTLFTWIKKNPSPTGRLYVMDEAQNFAPSGRATPSLESTLALAAQARKYGLGMIFATQAPKGIDNKIVSNATTHFYGRLSAPATIDAARELMAAKGGAADDIGRLTAGQFYFSTDGIGRPVKLRTPLCLSYHPKNPLGPEEVVAMAAADRRRLNGN